MNQPEDSHTIATPRTATISRSDTVAIGVCVFITRAELCELGVDPEETDTVEYRLVQMNDQHTLSMESITD